MISNAVLRLSMMNVLKKIDTLISYIYMTIEFDCLDHSYFKAEFTELQHRFKNVKSLMEKNKKLTHFTKYQFNI